MNDKAYNDFWKIKFYSLGKNVGEHRAVMAGLNHVSGDWAIIMDDDFQNPISELKHLINHSLNNDFDESIYRVQTETSFLFRNIGSYFNNKVANVMLDKPDKLYLSSFKSISKKVINEIIKYNLPFPYIDGLILRTTRNLGIIK